MSGYLKFLTWALANIETVKALLAKVQEIVAILKSIDFGGLVEVIPAANEGTLGITQAITVEPTAEEVELEAQALALLDPQLPSDTLAVRDGAKLRELFKLLQTYGPLVVQYAPTLIKLFGGK
jgi:hypothetical protein